MAILPGLNVERKGHRAFFHGSWHRGTYTNFIPAKEEIVPTADSIDAFIMRGWTPSSPFIYKSTKITAFGGCFAEHIRAHHQFPACAGI